MRKYRADAASTTRIDYGHELTAGLDLFPETAALAPSFEKLTDELNDAFVARRTKRKPLVRARAKLRLANYKTDQEIRSFHAALLIADGGRKGPLTDAMFPEGLGPVVAPAGSRQVKPTRDLIDRLTKSKHKGTDAVRKEWEPKLKGALGDLEGAVAAHTAATGADLDAFRTELSLREEHLLAVDKLAGLVRGAFPNDRTKQDLVFPETSADDDAGEAAAAAPEAAGK